MKRLTHADFSRLSETYGTAFTFKRKPTGGVKAFETGENQ